jgi:hypothetical protein
VREKGAAAHTLSASTLGMRVKGLFREQPSRGLAWRMLAERTCTLMPSFPQMKILAQSKELNPSVHRCSKLIRYVVLSPDEELFAIWGGRLSMSSPKNAAIKFGKESYEGRKTRETFT